ncbi:G3E family GTPase [Ilumatobacter fluminis]|uniref:G3E family GTPase n=1 Tax=Ilumatobacter fluminis TaxID=467091 RepID=A0A4R7I5J0_9ACTN|nr:GTP-binding protein [Ilumatobacter fluminis]TDT17953.1 G3E family GTPase [Ilumatobacter fluminis]
MTAPYQEPEFLPWDGRRVPITFVGGYLGAGKTSAINEVLTVADRPIAVVVNDAGAINLDARLIKGCDGDAIELTDGCVCCTSIDDMGAALDTIRARPEPPDHLVIELSGIAEPDNVTPWGRSAGFILDGVVTVVAADQLLDDDMPRWVRLHLEAQIGAADLLVLTKTDLVDPGDASEARSRLSALAPDIPIVDGSRDRREPGALGRFIAIGGHRDSDPSGVPGPTLFDLHQTHSVPIDGPMTRTAVDDLVASLPDRFDGRTIARAKAIIELVDGDTTRPALVQKVGPRWEVTDLFANEPSQPTDLVVITVDRDV